MNKRERERERKEKETIFRRSLSTITHDASLGHASRC